jgi:outer membrane protein assembly factor BamB
VPHTILSRVALAAATVLIIAARAPAGDADWPRFRGPNGQGISEATTVPAKWTADDYNWKVKLPGTGHSSPILWGDRIFLTCTDAETAKRIIVCLKAADGSKIWQRDYGSKTYAQNNDNSFASSTPAADAGGIVVTWSTPEEIALLALDLDGKEVWRRGLGPLVAKHGSGQSPIIVGDLVVLGNDQEDLNRMPIWGGPPVGQRAVGKSSLIAIDRKSGRTRWQVERQTALTAYSTPCVRDGEGGRPEIIFASTAHGITAVDAASGKVNWEVGGIFKDRCVASPVLGPGLVFAGYGLGTRGTLYVAVRPGSAEKKAEVAYEIQKPVPLVPTPIVKDGRLYLWHDDGTVACLKAETGETIWREKAGGSYYGSPVWVSGRLYCIARNGDVVVLAAGDKFEALARVPLGETSFATPAVAGGVMYLRTYNYLYSLGGKK